MECKSNTCRGFLCAILALGVLATNTTAQDDIPPGHISIFGGGGGSVTFGRLYDRARYGLHGTLGAAIRLAPGNTEAFELVGSGTGSLFSNDGEIGGDFLIATGGLEFRLVAQIDKPAHYFFGLGGGVARVREEIFTSEITGRRVAGFIEWGPYFAPGIGFDTPVSKQLRLFGQAHFVTIFGNEIGNYQYLQFVFGLRL